MTAHARFPAFEQRLLTESMEEMADEHEAGTVGYSMPVRKPERPA